jgi:hypothetical protein
VGAQQLANDGDVLDVVDPRQDDRQIARNALCPERRRAAAAAAYRVGRRTQRRIGVQHVARETLKQARLIRIDAEMAQLHLRSGPGQCNCAVEGRRVVMLISKVQHIAARRGDNRPESDACRPARRNPHPLAQREHGIEHAADRAR